MMPHQYNEMTAVLNENDSIGYKNSNTRGTKEDQNNNNNNKNNNRGPSLGFRQSSKVPFSPIPICTTKTSDFTIPMNIRNNLKNSPTNTEHETLTIKQQHQHFPVTTAVLNGYIHTTTNQNIFHDETDIESGCKLVSKREFHHWIKEHLARGFTNWKKTKANCWIFLLVLVLCVSVGIIVCYEFFYMGDDFWYRIFNPLWTLGSLFDLQSTTTQKDSQGVFDQYMATTTMTTSTSQTPPPTFIQVPLRPPFDRGKEKSVRINLDEEEMLKSMRTIQQTLTEVILRELGTRLNDYLWELSVDITDEVMSANHISPILTDLMDDVIVSPQPSGKAGYYTIMGENEMDSEKIKTIEPVATITTDVLLIIVQLKDLVQTSVSNGIELELDFKHKENTYNDDDDDDDDAHNTPPPLPPIYEKVNYKAVLQSTLMSMLVDQMVYMFAKSSSYRCCCRSATGPKCSTKQTQITSPNGARTSILEGNGGDMVCQLVGSSISSLSDEEAYNQISKKEKKEKEQKVKVKGEWNDRRVLELYMSLSTKHIQNIIQEETKCTLQLIAEDQFTDDEKDHKR